MVLCCLPKIYLLASQCLLTHACLLSTSFLFRMAPPAQQLQLPPLPVAYQLVSQQALVYAAPTLITPVGTSAQLPDQSQASPASGVYGPLYIVTTPATSPSQPTTVTSIQDITSLTTTPAQADATDAPHCCGYHFGCGRLEDFGCQ